MNFIIYMVSSIAVFLGTLALGQLVENVINFIISKTKLKRKIRIVKEIPVSKAKFYNFVIE